MPEPAGDPDKTKQDPKADKPEPRRGLRVHRASFNPQAPIRLPGKGPTPHTSVSSDDFEIRPVAIRVPVWPEGKGSGEYALVPHLLITPLDEGKRRMHEPVLVAMSGVLDWEPLDEELLAREAKATGSTVARAVR